MLTHCVARELCFIDRNAKPHVAIRRNQVIGKVIKRASVNAAQRHIDARRTERSARIEAWRVKAKSQGLDPSRPPFDLTERDNVDSLRYGDWNMDGVITIDEFGGRTRAQFMRSDRNGDGMVTPDEANRRRDTKPARGV